MLLRFGATNHLSLHTRQELSLVATKLKGREDGLVEVRGTRGKAVLPLAVVYGANASGKSNLIDALRLMRSVVLLSHTRGNPEGGVPRRPFLLDPAAETTPTTFDADFLIDGVRYHYGFSFDNEEFKEEWLYSFPEGTRRTLFERTSAREIHFGGSMRGAKKTLATFMRPNSLFVSTAAQNDHEELSKILTFFSSIRIESNISIARVSISRDFEKNDIDPRTIEFLRNSGTGVVGFRRNRTAVPAEMKEFQQGFISFIEKFVTDTIHDSVSIADEQTEIELAHADSRGGTVFFDLNSESAGTRRLLVLLNAAFRSLDEGTVLVVDELDASLHTQAAAAIVAMYASTKYNPKGAQLIATTHDTNLMFTDCLRRDEIWFAEKNDSGETVVYPLADIQTRQQDNLEKGYLQGRFGAVPFAGNPSTFIELANGATPHSKPKEIHQ